MTNIFEQVLQDRSGRFLYVLFVDKIFFCDTMISTISTYDTLARIALSIKVLSNIDKSSFENLRRLVLYQTKKTRMR